MFIDESGNPITCKCGICIAVGDKAVSGKTVVWFMWADLKRRKEENPTDSMFLRATCDNCGETVDEVVMPVAV